MRIAMIGQKGMPARYGGVERHVHDLSVRLVQAGNVVRVYSRPWYTLDTPTTVDGVEQVYLPSIHTKHLDTITHTFLASIHATRSNANIVHYHGVGPALWSWIPRLFSPRKRVVTTFHSIDRKHEKWDWFARFMLRTGEWAACRFAHKTITISRTLQQYARDVYDKHTTYIPNAVPLYSRIEECKTLAQWGLQKDTYLLVVTRLIPHKGVHHIIDAYQELSKSHPELTNQYPLVIVGDGVHTAEYVRALHESARTNPNIIFTGFQSGRALEELFSGAHLFLHASSQEGLPITVLEAMSHGLPMLLSDIPEHQELLNNRKLRFEPENSNALANALVTTLTDNDELLKASARENRQRIEQEYQWDHIAPQIMALYDRTQQKYSLREEYVNA